MGVIFSAPMMLPVLLIDPPSRGPPQLTILAPFILLRYDELPWATIATADEHTITAKHIDRTARSIAPPLGCSEKDV
jgi:hypothetical protein